MNKSDDTYTQLTVRGIDARTKAGLERRAKELDVSINRLAVRILKEGVGADTLKDRIRRHTEFLGEYVSDPEDERLQKEALAWSDKASFAKQQKEARENHF